MDGTETHGGLLEENGAFRPWWRLSLCAAEANIGLYSCPFKQKMLRRSIFCASREMGRPGSGLPIRTTGGQSGEQFACSGVQLCACWTLSPIISLQAEIAKVPSNARKRAKFRARIIERTSL